MAIEVLKGKRHASKFRVKLVSRVALDNVRGKELPSEPDIQKLREFILDFPSALIHLSASTYTTKSKAPLSQQNFCARLGYVNTSFPTNDLKTCSIFYTCALPLGEAPGDTFYVSNPSWVGIPLPAVLLWRDSQNWIKVFMTTLLRGQ